MVGRYARAQMCTDLLETFETLQRSSRIVLNNQLSDKIKARDGEVNGRTRNETEGALSRGAEALKCFEDLEER